MIPRIVQTADGSMTCLDSTTGELYHNKAGAYSEALEHYAAVVELYKCLSKEPDTRCFDIRILDVCFGLGYNSFVLLDKLIEFANQPGIQAKVKKEQINCYIVGVEADREILSLVPQVLAGTYLSNWQKYNIAAHAQQMVESWQNNCAYEFKIKAQIPIFVSFKIELSDLRKMLPKFVIETAEFDYIFHDGFSPRSMPELWTEEIFSSYTKIMYEQGCIVTYSSAAAVRGAMRKCGLTVVKTKPLGGKSGGTVAFKVGKGNMVNRSAILPLNDEENKRLDSRSSISYRDPDLRSTRSEIIKRRIIELEASGLSVYQRSK